MMDRVHCVFDGLLAAGLVLVTAGCQTSVVSPSLAVQPERYRSITVLPVCCGNLLPAGDVRAAGEPKLISPDGQRLASALGAELARRGYQLTGPIRVLSGEDDWCKLDLIAGSILRRQFDLERIRADCGDTNGLYSCGFVSSLPVLQKKLGLPEAGGLVLLECWAEYDAVPPPHPREMETADTWIAIIGFFFGAAPTGGYPSNTPGPPAVSMNFSLYLFDSKTGEIIYHACRTHSHLRPDTAVRKLLGGLPKIAE